MQDKLVSGCIRKFIEDYECTKRRNGEPCRMNGTELLKIIKKNDFENILKKIKEHEEHWQKFIQIETKILSIFTLKDFFELMLPEIKKAFQIPYIWLTVIENTALAELTRQASNATYVKTDVGFIKQKDFERFFKSGPKPVIVCNYTDPYSSFFPESHNFTIRSMALVPLYMDGVVIGTLNFGHFVSNRFVPGMDTSFIQHLIVKISLCLSRVNSHEKLKFLDHHDSLTGLFNRSSMMTELNREFNRALRYKKDLSVIFFGLDSFRELNDLYGHDYGDMIIKYVAEVLKSQKRSEDIAARFIGGEFVLIIPESNGEVSEVLVRRIQDFLDENPFESGEIKLHLSLNYGISSIDEKNIKSPQHLLKLAYKKLNGFKKHDLHDTGKPHIYRIRAS